MQSALGRRGKWWDPCPRGQLGKGLVTLMRWSDCQHNGIDLTARTFSAFGREAAVVRGSDESFLPKCAFWRGGSQRRRRPCFSVFSAGLMKEHFNPGAQYLLSASSGADLAILQDLRAQGSPEPLLDAIQFFHCEENVYIKKSLSMSLKGSSRWGLFTMPVS